MRIHNSTVLLTGATGGLGEAIARELRGRGAKLILTGRRTDVLEGLASELGARALAADLADRAAVDRLLGEAGAVDILVANAALPGAGRLEEFELEEIDRTLEVNLRAPIAMAHALAPAMAARGARPPAVRLLAVGQGADRDDLAVQRDEVRAARLRAGAAPGAARARRRRLGRLPGLHPRSGDVRGHSARSSRPASARAAPRTWAARWRRRSSTTAPR